MRQLEGLPTAIAEVMMKVELAKAGIPAVQVLGAEKEMPRFQSTYFGVLQFGHKQVVIFKRTGTAWEMRWQVCDDKLVRAIDPAVSSESSDTSLLRFGDSSFLIDSQKRLVDIVLSLVSAYGPALSAINLCSWLEEGYIDWSMFGSAFRYGNIFPHPRMEMFDLVVTEARTLRALGRALNDNIQIVKHDREAIRVLEGAIARHALMRRSEELTSEADGIRGALAAFCKSQADQCESLLKPMHRDDRERAKVLAQLEWFLMQRATACTELGRHNHASSIRKKLEKVRGELFALYVLWYRMNLTQIETEHKLYSRMAFTQLDAMMHDPTQPRKVAVLAGRLAQLTGRLGLAQIAAGYDQESAKLRHDLSDADKAFVDQTLASEFGIE